jgi:hypothetical protein
VWSGHSCPLPLTLVLQLILKIKINTKINPKIKSGGQECPPHTNKDAVILFPEGTSIHV